MQTLCPGFCAPWSSGRTPGRRPARRDGDSGPYACSAYLYCYNRVRETRLRAVEPGTRTGAILNRLLCRVPASFRQQRAGTRYAVAAIFVAFAGIGLSPAGGHSAPAYARGQPIPVPLGSYANNTAFTAASPTTGFDGEGDTFPASLRPEHGSISSDGVDYLLSDGATGDNVVALGQTIELPPGQYTLAHLLVASNGGDTIGTATVHYTDGSSTSATFNSPDWLRGPESATLSTAFHDTPTGRQTSPSSLYAEDVWFDQGLVATSITLPTTQLPVRGAASIHIFALSVQPVVAGNGLAVVAGHSTTNTMSRGAQMIQAIVENIGTRWYTTRHPATVTVVGQHITTTSAARITWLAPGEETPVQIGIRTTDVVAGKRLRATIVAQTSNGISVSEHVKLTVGLPHYTATDESLEQHSTPEWYDDAKFGIFIHYGIYSVPAWAPVGGVYEEWYWHSMFQKDSPTYEHQLHTYGPNSTYDDFIPKFTARKFDPRALVTLIQAAGARYFVFVAKHHDGFSLFHTTVSRRNSVDMGPHKDLVRLLFDADRRYTPGVHPGVYYSLPEWYNPAFQPTKHLTKHFPGGPPIQYVTGAKIPYTGYTPVKNYVTQYQVPQLDELIDQYHPDILWCDIGGPNRSLDVIAHFYNVAAARARRARSRGEQSLWRSYPRLHHAGAASLQLHVIREVGDEPRHRSTFVRLQRGNAGGGVRHGGCTGRRTGRRGQQEREFPAGCRPAS